MASGDTLYAFYPTDNQPPSASQASLDFRNFHPVLDFDAASTEIAVFTGIIPRNFTASAGVTVYIHWSSADVSGGVDEVRWDVFFERIQDDVQDTDTDGFTASPQSVSDLPASASGEVSVCNIAFTNAQADAIAAGDLFRLKIQRDHDHADDDMSGDAELHAIEIKET